MKTSRLSLIVLLPLLVACGSSEKPKEQGAQPKAMREGSSPSSARRELDALGPSEEERLAAIKVDGRESAAIRKKIAGFRVNRKQGENFEVLRDGREALVREHGLKAVPFLIKGTQDGNYWARRTCSSALSDLCGNPSTRQDARWLCFKYEAGPKLIAMWRQGARRWATLAEEQDLGREVKRMMYWILDQQPPEEPKRPLDFKRRTQESQAKLSQAWGQSYDEWRREENRKRARRDELRAELGLQ